MSEEVAKKLLDKLVFIGQTFDSNNPHSRDLAIKTISSELKKAELQARIDEHNQSCSCCEEFPDRCTREKDLTTQLEQLERE